MADVYDKATHSAIMKKVRSNGNKSTELRLIEIFRLESIKGWDRMSEVRRNGNYEQWVKFFLQAIYESAEDATITIDKLTALHDKNIATISDMGRAAKTALRLFSYLEENPIIEIQKTATALDTTFKTIRFCSEVV